MFLKSVRIFKLFYYAIFGSVILKLFKNGLFLLCHFKTHFKNISNSASSFIIDCKNAFIPF
ncbi:hypothetical protein D2C74_05275 [Helicobacter pylori]|nr:hypothetical protein D2C74_05275 [Helicobacter pylori]